MLVHCIYCGGSSPHRPHCANCGAPLSIAAAKETVVLATEMSRSAALRAARHLWERAYRSADAQEGPAAFSEKRAPVWRGE